MRLKSAFVAILLCHALVLPMFAQEDVDNATEQSFSLTSQRTYLPGEKPEVSVYSHNVNALEFRVYRVNDPVKFFSQMQELHSFGGRAPSLPKQSALSWKSFTPGSTACGRGFATSFARSFRPSRASRFVCGRWAAARRNRDQRLKATPKCRC